MIGAAGHQWFARKPACGVVVGEQHPRGVYAVASSSLPSIRILLFVTGLRGERTRHRLASAPAACGTAQWTMRYWPS
jgi:hypothetical protein